MITIESSPSGLPSVQDDMWHIASSDNSSNTDFKFVVDIYVNGDQIIRAKPWPEPSNGKMYFNAGPSVRNEMIYEWFEPVDNSFFVSQPDMSGQVGIVYQYRIGEDYSGITTLNMASGEVSGYNWAPNLLKRRVTGLSTKLNKWLTNRPLFGYTTRDFTTTDRGENLFIGFYTDAATLTAYIETFGFDNQLIDTSGPFPLPAKESGFYQLNIGANGILAGEFGGYVIEEGVKYYEVWLNDFDRFRVYLTCNAKYNNTSIHFLNRWGLWDTLRFDLASRLSMDIERKGFGQRDHKFNGSSVDYMSDANRYYEGKINYSNKQNWTYKLNADALTDEEWEWASDLISSPQILMEIDGYFYPVTIKKNNYDYMKFVNDRLKPLEIEFELNTSRYSQLR